MLYLTYISGSKESEAADRFHTSGATGIVNREDEDQIIDRTLFGERD